MPSPRASDASARMITRCDPDGVPRGLILMLHGGRADGRQPVDDRNASWRRSRWMQNQIRGRANQAGLGVWLLRYAVRGWNASDTATPSPVPDARWALDQVRRELAEVPVVLLGHSMGGRTAVAVADHRSVAGVVALAPWLTASDPVDTLRGKALAAAHGSRDRITSARETAAYVRRAEAVAASTEFCSMGRVGHYMLRTIPAWNCFAVSRSLRILEDADRRYDGACGRSGDVDQER